jgi:hypothetical protein
MKEPDSRNDILAYFYLAWAALCIVIAIVVAVLDK